MDGTARDQIRADTEQTLLAHQAGEDGKCGNCREVYPCDPAWFASEALERLDRRRPST